MKASNVKFGIEIECYMPTEHANRDSSHLGSGVQVNWAPEGWGSKRDGSLTSSYDGYTAVEIVSPILEGEDGLCQLYYMLETMQQLGVKTDKTCGLHVHVDARNLNSLNIEAIRKAFIRYEKAFYGLNAEKAGIRWSNMYCKNSHVWGTDRGDRYRSLNLTNYYSRYYDKTTVEIRCWFGTLDIATVVMAAYMAVALVAKATTEGAEDGEQYGTATEAATEFCRAHFNTEDYRIVPDCTVREITKPLVKACKKADRVMPR